MNKMLLISLVVIGASAYGMDVSKQAIMLKPRTTFAEMLSDYVATERLNAYDSTMRTLPEDAAGYEKAYGAFITGLKTLPSDPQYSRVFDHLINILGKAEIFARHIIYLYNCSLDVSEEKGLAVARLYLNNFKTDAKLVIYLSLLKLRAPISLLNGCLLCFDGQGLDRIAQALKKEKHNAGAQEKDTADKILESIEASMLNDITRRYATMPDFSLRKDLLQTPQEQANRRNRSITDLTGFLDGFEQLLNQRLAQVSLIEEKVQTLVELRKAGSPEFEESVRQVLRDHADIRSFLVKYLILEWAVQHVMRVQLAHDVVAIHLYGSCINSFARFAETTLSTAVDQVTALCKLCVQTYPTILDFLNSHAGTLDGHTTMYKFLISHGSVPIAELLSRFLLGRANKSVKEGDTKDSAEWDRITTLVGSMPQALPESVFTELVLISRIKPLLALDRRVKQRYCDDLINLFFPYFTKDEDRFIEFFMSLQMAYRTAGIDVNLKELIAVKLEEKKVPQRAEFCQIMAFDL